VQRTRPVVASTCPFPMFCPGGCQSLILTRLSGSPSDGTFSRPRSGGSSRRSAPCCALAIGSLALRSPPQRLGGGLPGASAARPRPPSAEWSWRGQIRNRVIMHRCPIRACGFSAPYAPDGLFFTTPGGIRNSARWSLAPAPQPGKALGLTDPTVDVQSIRFPTGRCC
jgi:hypothetical protein